MTEENQNEWVRQLSHLTAMCDGKKHVFFDHAMARDMRKKGWIEMSVGSYWIITSAGRQAVANKLVPG